MNIEDQGKSSFVIVLSMFCLTQPRNTVYTYVFDPTSYFDESQGIS